MSKEGLICFSLFFNYVVEKSPLHILTDPTKLLDLRAFHWWIKNEVPWAYLGNENKGT